MKKRLIVLFAAVVLALPLGANVAMAQGGGNSNDVPGDTGNACPENSPQGADEDPSCGVEGKGGEKGNNGDNSDGNNGDNGQGNNGAERGDVCPPASPNAGGEPPCGDGGDGDGGDIDDGNGDGDGGDPTDPVAATECATVAENPPPPIVIEIPAQPLAYACVMLFPEADDTAGCPGGALPVAVPAHPLADACVVVGPDAPEA